MTTSESCWYPENHRYTGSCDPGNQMVLPHYANMPESIRVYDTAVRTQGWNREQKKAWRASRAKALYRWGFSDALLDFRERGLVDGDYRPEGITLRVQSPAFPSSNNYGGFGLDSLLNPSASEYDPLVWDAGKGYVNMHWTTVNNAFLGRNYSLMTGAMSHEFGHAFGFGHGGWGLMRSALIPPYQPSSEELLAFRSYWGLS